MSPPALVGSYPTVSPITCARPARRARRPEPSAGLFSVALVVGSPRLAVNQSTALWCSDFPLVPVDSRPARSLKPVEDQRPPDPLQEPILSIAQRNRLGALQEDRH